MKTSVKQQQQQILYNFTDVLRHGEAKIITENQRTEAKSTLEPVLGVQRTTKEKKKQNKTKQKSGLTKEVSNQKELKS